MSVLYLVRHGQASFGSLNYDLLSERGHQQSRALGHQLRALNISPSRVLTGNMVRQQQTMQEIIGSAQWDLPITTDTGWDEFSAANLIAAYPQQDPEAQTDSRAFQRILEKASARWASGNHDDDYAETFTAFTSRVRTALINALTGLGSGQSAVVVSSSGAIAWTAAQLISGGFDQWLALNRVTVNSGVSKIVAGSSGTTLVSFNDHGHLPGNWVTYR
ncbi:histidine phosphatase family protein [Arthrobacter sp. MYb213]|uniref:histidine phosphatase family protein n=1 Tax=Arthrobacter sp. MYb213 TaxID=1848595 RepID=UPI000CFD18D2|nr:histidine phosphatase family protein [Arthrobacter sp. MYb213]PRB70525.1 histidine phosphatase family protein [Arthrobacter sp. MYb213]